MDVYLAARYSRHKELQDYAYELMEQGHTITSRWIWGDHQIDDDGLSTEAKKTERERFAEEDYSDLMGSNICISFTEVPRSSNSRGGRHVEFGIAIATNMRCIVVGPRENVFHCLPFIEIFDNFRAVIEVL